MRAVSQLKSSRDREKGEALPAGQPFLDEGETHARPWKGGDYPFDAKEIMVQGGSGGGIGCVWGERGVWVPGKEAMENQAGVRLRGTLNVRPRGTPQGDSELVYRSSQAAPQHWFPTSSNEWSLWGHPALPWNQLWVRT